MSAPPRRSAHNRPALITLVIVATFACLALGWWQWERFESASGTGQNLGYALQWPLFAGFAVFAYFRFVRLESEFEQDDEQHGAVGSGEDTGLPAGHKSRQAPAKPKKRSAKPAAPREIPAGLLPERPKAAKNDDPVLAEYNNYLAELHARDIEEQVGDAGLNARDTQRSAG